MELIEVGDLVEVKRDKDLSPTLRFYFNKKGIVTKKFVLEEDFDFGGIMQYEWVVLFDNGKAAVFRDYELKIVAKASKK